MDYEKEREMMQTSMQHWVSQEIFSVGWFILIITLLLFYGIWFKLLDKKRATELLLIGSLAAVMYHLNMMIMIDIFGFVEYRVHILPIHTPAFISSVTLAPIIVMLAQQYSTSWIRYMLWSGIGIAILNFVIFPIYIYFEILQFHQWNVFFHFIVLFGVAVFVRSLFLWIIGTQKRHLQKENT